MSLADWAEFKEQVRSRTDLVSLIAESRTVTPRRGGREFVALCAFHDDHNPSMTINPERQTYKCWSCQAGGDCFSYVMEIESVDFRTALEMLAKRAGLEMPRSEQGSRRSQTNLKDEMFEAVKWAAEQFHQYLLSASVAEPARNYLLDRGFSEETWLDFQLGFVPDGWDWLVSRNQNRFKLEVLEAAQLIRPRSSGHGYFDFFRHRVMFPILDTQGRPVAFGGRILPGADESAGPKYLNSPDSEIFHKSHLLYALRNSREEIRRTNTTILVEGYTDCIALHQAGQGNVVAALGTALVETHVSLLKRFCSKVVLVLDGDDPGQDAADRSLVKFIPADLDIRVLTLPEGVDPADFVRTEGIEVFQQAVDQAPDVWDFKFRRLLAQHGGQINSFTSQQILESMLELLSMTPGIASSPREDRFISQLCKRVGVQEATARKRLAEIRRERSKTSDQHNNQYSERNHGFDSEPETESPRKRLIQSITRDQAGKDARLDCEVIQFLLTSPELADPVFSTFSPTEVRLEPLQYITQLCFDAWETGKPYTFTSLLVELEDLEMKGLVVWLMEQADKKEFQDNLDRQTVLAAELVACLEKRRDQRDHQAVRVQVETSSESTARVDNETTDLLRRAAEYHAKRATRNKSSA